MRGVRKSLVRTTPFCLIWVFRNWESLEKFVLFRLQRQGWDRWIGSVSCTCSSLPIALTMETPFRFSSLLFGKSCELHWLTFVLRLRRRMPVVESASITNRTKKEMIDIKEGFRIAYVPLLIAHLLCSYVIISSAGLDVYHNGMKLAYTPNTANCPYTLCAFAS